MKKPTIYKKIFEDSSDKQMFKGDKFYKTVASDPEAMREIELFIDNDQDVYRQILAIIKNIKQKIKTGRYNHALAPKLWSYLVEFSMKKYAKEFDDPKRWMDLLSTKERKVLSEKLADYYYDEISNGNYN